ncbi:hypothetical protein YQE_11951, partial [Dendroctonus ponderosae]
MVGSRVYIGGLPYGTNERDLERFFRGYGRMREVTIKSGYGFVEFDDYRDADDAVYELNGKRIMGERVTVERARGTPRGRDRWGDSGSSSSSRGRDRDRNSGRDRYGPPTRTAHRVIVENLSSRVSWQDLKDYMRQAGEVTYADAHREHKNEGVVEFASRSDMKNAVEKLDDTELNGRRIKVVEDKGGRRQADRGLGLLVGRIAAANRRVGASLDPRARIIRDRDPEVVQTRDPDQGLNLGRSKNLAKTVQGPDQTRMDGMTGPSQRTLNEMLDLSQEKSAPVQGPKRTVTVLDRYREIDPNRERPLKNGPEVRAGQEDGRKFAEFKNNIRQLEETSLGFVVDTKPDNIPAKVIDCLYLGSQDCCDLAVLRQYSIKFVLSVGVEPFAKSPNVTYKFVDILDLVETDLEKYLHECMHFVDVCVRNKTNVLVHCNAGISRSASVVIAYLIIKRNLLFDDAYALVKQARATVKPNDGFMKQLQHLKKK